VKDLECAWSRDHRLKVLFKTKLQKVSHLGVGLKKNGDYARRCVFTFLKCTILKFKLRFYQMLNFLCKNHILIIYVSLFYQPRVLELLN